MYGIEYRRKVDDKAAEFNAPVAFIPYRRLSASADRGRPCEAIVLQTSGQGQFEGD